MSRVRRGPGRPYGHDRWGRWAAAPDADADAESHRTTPDHVIFALSPLRGDDEGLHRRRLTCVDVHTTRRRRSFAVGSLRPPYRRRWYLGGGTQGWNSQGSEVRERDDASDT